ncbi:DUF916 and DUF3324 domain-containing protein [Lactococcus nasutitermitis]|uniref:DUF916 and DUF3324 domain-containing protein n=1 Tax=Lactococcus nasutitermitis TaxID=1652957 RepID=A0ABV9JB90_9LACT|nr:DUF916 and DUF3324 domain-containing protein [Lactococcus nasutitermitis]
MNKKRLTYLIASLTVLFCIGATTKISYADGANFSVTPIAASHQTDKNLGYFNLLLNPGESEKLNFQIVNSSSSTIKINTTFGTAFTTSTGNVGYTPNLVKPDASMKINLKDYVKLPKTLTLPAHASAEVTATVTMPTKNFTGVIAGGFNFEENTSDTTAPSSKKTGVTITNNYRYVIGLVMQESMTKVAPSLNLGSVKADQVNERNVISAQLTNPAMAYLMQMNTIAEVTSLKDKSIKYDFSNSAMEMAPNSNFNLAIPVSIQGVLNGKTSQPLKPGKYHLHMIVYGNKDNSGQYQTLVNGQVTKYDYKWTFDKDFTITGNQATTLNAKDPTINHKTTINWLLIIGIVIIILFLFIIILLLFKRRNKEEDDKKEQEN